MYYDIANALNKNEIVDNFTGSGIARGNYQQYNVRFAVKNTDNIYLKNECISD